MDLLDLIVKFIIIPLIVMFTFVIIPEMIFRKIDNRHNKVENKNITLFKYNILKKIKMDNYINENEKYAKIKYKEVTKLIASCKNCKYLNGTINHTCKLSNTVIDKDLESNKCECFCRK